MYVYATAPIRTDPILACPPFPEKKNKKKKKKGKKKHSVMPEPPPTVLSLKQDFITAQVRVLSAPLRPSRAWRRANHDSAASGGRLSDAVVDEALVHANNTLKQHNQRAYAPQATRHVAEQIDALYYNAGERAVVISVEDRAADGLGLEADFGKATFLSLLLSFFLPVPLFFFLFFFFCFSFPVFLTRKTKKKNKTAHDEVIAALPPSWDHGGHARRYPAQSGRYAELAASLSALSARRAAVRHTVDRLRRMEALLRPFCEARHVQENLVTRGGDIEKELERMRKLLARVGGRVAGLPDRRGADAGAATGTTTTTGTAGSVDLGIDAMDVDDVDVAEARKVQDLLTQI